MALRGKTRIGNWQEELVYEADKKKALADVKSGGGLLSQQILAKAKHHTKEYKLANLSEDGYLRFNVPYMLQNAETNAFLSIDMDDKAQVGAEWRVAATTAPAKVPLRRNSWILVPVPSADDEFLESKGEKDIVHYGQKFLIATVPELTEPAVYLSSQQLSPSNLSKITKNQEVYFSALGRQFALWCCVYAHPEYRFEMEGQAVKANTPILLRHTLTNVPLASGKFKYGNDFGAEFEVCCHKYAVVAAKHGNTAEKPNNLWAIVTGPAPEDDPDYQPGNSTVNSQTQ